MITGRPHRDSASGATCARQRQAGLTLIELLIAMSVSVVVSAMVFGTWFALSDSFSYSATSSKARNFGRQAIGRMAREVRDAQAQTSATGAFAGDAAVIRARSRWIAVMTTFNDEGSASSSTLPRLVVYRLYENGELWRFEDNGTQASGALPDDGDIEDLDLSVAEGTAFDPLEPTRAEGRTLLTKHIVNGKVPSTSLPTPLFRYFQADATGDSFPQDNVYNTNDRQKILTVQIHLLVDLNPDRSPTYADLMTAAQLRNQRLY